MNEIKNNVIEIEINGIKLEAEQGTMVIEAADKAGIYIPRFCYHRKLSIAANCRMCLVDVEKAPKALPACATPVTPGMRIFTQSEKALQSQRAVMEFLLINHPLDCPVCDQGGECELQDLAMGYGRGISRYTEGKRAVADENLGPLIASDMTRCIQCTRCVRFGDEVAGMRELGATGRGEHTEIGTYVQHAIRSEVSGNIIDLCPVGALTSKPFRFTGRAWELRQHAYVAPHDCLGSNIYVHTRGEEFTPNRKVMRVVPRSNEAINEIWLSDRDRFSYTALSSSERVMQPLIKENGVWRAIDWSGALSIVHDRLQTIIEEQGAGQIGGLISPNSTTEECYLFQKWLRGIGCQNVDHRLRENDFRDQAHLPAYLTLGLKIQELEKLDALLLIGSDVRREQPVANLRIRKGALNNMHAMAVNPIDYDFNFPLQEKIIVGTSHFVSTLAKILKALFEVTGIPMPAVASAALSHLEPTEAEKRIALQLNQQSFSAVILGAFANQHPEAATIRALTQWIAQLSHSRWGSLNEGANSTGAWLAGAVPHRSAAGVSVEKPGLEAKSMWQKRLSAYVLYGVEPEFDAAQAQEALAALQEAQTVIVLSPFRNKHIDEYADIILPIAPFTEMMGTFVNIEGAWQTVSPLTPPYGEVKPGWKVLRVLGNQFDLADFEYISAEQVLHELKVQVDVMSTANANYAKAMDFPELNLTKSSNLICRLAYWPMYRNDALVRRSEPLQKAMTDHPVIRMNRKLAEQLGFVANEKLSVKQDASQMDLILQIDDSIADDQVIVPAGLEATAGFGCAFGSIELQKAG